MIRYLLFFYCIFTIFCNAFAADSPCLKYEPDVVSLTGQIKRVVFPGPPNYESIKEGDKPETYWILYLNRSICVQGDETAKDENAETETHVWKVQLIISDYKKYSSLMNKQVTAKGTLMHSSTGHHHTAVLLQVQSLE